MGESDYVSLVREIISNSDALDGRNGRTLCKIGATLRFNLESGALPLLTTKRVAWKTCLKELLWFISGSTSNKELNSKGVHIWDANADKDFLSLRGLAYDEGDLGPVYGHQWRHFNAEYHGSKESYAGKGVDQLAQLVAQLSDENTRSSRRLIMSAWNPLQVAEMALPPCHVLCQFHVLNHKLSCTMYQRSADVGLGLPFNIASYSFLTHLLAKHCGLDTGELIIFIGNAHIYMDHIDALTEQIENPIRPPPNLAIKRRANSISEYCLADFVVSNYSHASSVKMKLIA